MGIENIKVPATQVKTVLLLHTPEDQQHLNLLFLQYMLKQRGFRTLYIGNNLSFDHVKTIIEFKRPDYLVVHPSLKEKRGNLTRFIQRIFDQFATIQFISIGNVLSVKGIEFRYKHAAALQEGNALIV